MPVVIVCCVLLSVGVLAIVRWGSLDIGATAAAPNIVQRYWWWAAVGFYTGLASAIFVVGPAGRLAMRILAATAGSAAQGRRTEADEIVGQITVDGTIGLFLLVGLLFGLASTFAYLVVRRWLPARRGGGVVYGLLLLAVLATRIDPLRRNNNDFDLVGPGWLAIVIFVAMALIQGMAVVAFAGRISRVLPMPSKRLKHVLPYVPLLITLPAAPIALALLLGFAVTLLAGQSPKMLDALRSPRFLLAGRVALVLLAVAALPGTISALTSISGRP